MLLPLIAISHLGLVRQPNVVLFLVDDLGWQDTSLSFGIPEKIVGRHFRTPDLASLAARGTQVNQAYSSSPVCTPTRVALLTGTNPARNHITNWVQTGQDTDEAIPGMDFSKWNMNGVQPHDYQTLPEIFKAAGYHTLQVGKAHFGAGGTQGANPTTLGFDRTIGGSAAGHPSSYYGLQNFAAKKSSPNAPPAHNDVPDLKAYHGKDIYLEEALASEASKEIAQLGKSQKPMFLWFATYAVHAPIQPNRKYLSHYRNLDPTEAAYATMVETYDAALGTLISAFKAAGQLDNTIFVFTSDNGGLSESMRGGYLNMHNLPLRSGKGSAYEGGTRVPLVFAGPSVPAGKTLSKTWMTSTDLFATIPALANLRAKAEDGFSFSDAIRNTKDAPRSEVSVCHYPHNRGFRGPGLEPFSSIRMGSFKAIFFYISQRWELYNLDLDIGETREVSTKRGDKLKEMAEKLKSELKRMNAQFPTDLKTGKPIEPTIP